MRGLSARDGVVRMSERDEPREPEHPAGRGPSDAQEGGTGQGGTDHDDAYREEAADQSATAFLPIGITFFGVGIAFLASDDTRSTAWAFLPLGVTFLILGMNANAKNRRGGAARSSREPE